MKQRWRIVKMVGAILLVLASIRIADVWTIKVYSHISGNGNPGIISFILGIPALLYVAFHLFHWVRNLKLNWVITLCCLVIGSIYILWGINVELSLYLLKINELLKLHPTDYVTDIMSGITIYTNNILFNNVTVSVFLVSVYIFSVLSKLFSNKR